MIVNPDDGSEFSKASDTKQRLSADEGKSYASPPPYVAPPSQRPRPSGLPRPSGSGIQSGPISSSSSSASTSPSYRLRPPNQHGPNGSNAALVRPSHSQGNLRLSATTSREPPPPSSFSRSPPRHIPYPPFQPIFLIASGRFLDKGFPPVAPPATVRPHPFAVHDVNQGDWIRFLDDIRKASTLSEKQISLAEDLPIVSLLPVVNTLVASAIKSHMKKKRAEPAGQMVDTWNHHFFNPRKMEVILMKGPVRISGQNNHPIPNLHTPETVSFSLSSVPGLPNGHGHAMSSSSSGSSASMSRQSLHDEHGVAVNHRKLRVDKHSGAEKDKTYRLFVVSTSRSGV